MLSEIPTIQDALSPTPSSAEAGIEGAPVVGREGSRVDRLGSLVLTRHVGESIMIGAEVEVSVAGIRLGTARLRIVAPRSVSVHRREVFDAIKAGLVAPTPPASGAGAVAPLPGKGGGGLVLARVARQSIMIGEEVELAVVEVRPSMVKLKVTAPRSTAVHRLEIYKAIRDGFA